MVLLLRQVLDLKANKAYATKHIPKLKIESNFI